MWQEQFTSYIWNQPQDHKRKRTDLPLDLRLLFRSSCVLRSIFVLSRLSILLTYDKQTDLLKVLQWTRTLGKHFMSSHILSAARQNGNWGRQTRRNSLYIFLPCACQCDVRAVLRGCAENRLLKWFSLKIRNFIKTWETTPYQVCF